MKQRIISAAVALIICIPIILIGGIWFDIGISLITCLGLRELINLNKKEYTLLMKGLAYITLIIMVLYNRVFNTQTFEIVLCISAFTMFLPLIFYNKKTYNFESAIYLFGSIVFLGFVFNLLRDIRFEDIYLFVFLFLITILTDTFAYFCGKAFGKHKLIPSVSPNKTIEGSVCGTIISTIISSIFYIYEVNPSVNIPLIIFIVFLLSIIGQLGDLVFSSIKRYYGIKDYSNIMPGHGGILDRLDSIIFVVMGYTILTILI